MIRLLFQRGLFDEASTANSALALQCLAPGLVAFSLVNILARAFYALEKMWALENEVAEKPKAVRARRAKKPA